VSRKAAIVVAFVLGAALYLPSLGHGYVWDDRTLIAENRFLGDAREIGRNLTSDFFRRSAEPSEIGHWRPVVTASYMIDRATGAGSPRAFHLTNALLHGAAAALLALLALSLGLPVPAALAASALFATHPVHVEAVSWISGRTDLLCGVFALVAMTIDARGGPWALGALATFLAIGSKEMAVVIPFAVVLRAVLLPRVGDTPWRALWPHLAAIALYAVLRFGVLGIVPRAPAAAGAGRIALFWTWWSAFAEYARALAWPVSLSVVSPVALVPSPLSLRVLSGVVLFAVLVTAAWTLRARLPIVSWGLFGFLASLLPLTNFLVPVRAISSVSFPWAERFLFVPSIFLAVAIGALSMRPRARPWALVAIGVAAGLLGARSLARERVWSSQRSLFEAAVREHPEDVPARVNLAAALLDAGKAKEADDLLSGAVAASPGDPIAHYLLGNAKRQRGDLAAAEAEYRRALSIRPVYPQALINLGLVLAAGKDLDGAEAAFREADRQLGGAPETKVNLAIVMRLRGRTADAAALYREALALDPAFEPAREGLASLSP
jgi:hypothetical protein